MTNSATFTTSEASDENLGNLLLEVLPRDDSTIGNMSDREALGRAAGRQISEKEYEAAKDKALGLGLVVKGRGRGGYAIKAHRKAKLDGDPEYYQSLSLRLEEIIQKYQNKWEELVQQLLLFRDGMEREKSQENEDLGLSETEGAFYRTLMKAATSSTEVDALDEATHQRVLDLTKELVSEFQEATQIVGFFKKWDGVARIKRQIKRSILDQPFGDKDLVDPVTERFMDLGKRNFR